MITQTITQTSNSNTIYSTPEEALEDFNSIFTEDDLYYLRLYLQFENDGLVSTNIVLNDAKTGIIITRQWDDDSWNTYYSLIKDLNYNTIFKTNDADGWLMTVTTDTGISYSSE